MNFDKLVTKILQESKSRLPILDGEREIYIRSVSMEDGMCFGTFDREDEYNTQEWDDDYEDYGATVICTTQHFSEALKVLDDAFKDEENYSPYISRKPGPLPTEAVEKITKDLGYLQGTWKIISDLSNSNCFMIGVEVDSEYYRVQGVKDVAADIAKETGESDISDW